MPKEYPKHLIPNKSLKELSENELNIFHHIGVWVDSTLPLTDDDGYLSASAVSLKRIPHFSNNKIPNSVERDLNIQFREGYEKKYLLSWAEGMDGVLPEPEHFDYIDIRNHYFLIISDINGYNGTYEKNDIQYSFDVFLKHKPTVSNYWHFEFSIISNGKEVDYSKSAWINSICASIRGHIIIKAKFEI